jgi:glutaconyl-CoA/methylmalonyl-CoA decarboxylase subunit gamma
MKYIVTVNEKNYEVEVEQGEARVLSVSAAPTPAVPSETLLPASVATHPAPAAVAAPVGAGEALTAPMPGTVTNVLKKPGDKVKAGEVVLIMEAMKMENEIVSRHAGTIIQMLVSKGSVVNTGDALGIIR